MPDQPNPPPPAGPEPGAAKPTEPGPEEPQGIAASILPQRKRDAARHPDVPLPSGAGAAEGDGDD